MSNQNETGHAKNVANLIKYVQFLTSLGPAYNPAIDSIKLTALNALYTNAKAKIDALRLIEDAWKTDTNNREIAFQALNKFSTRLLNTLKSTNANQQTIDDFTSLVFKVRGAGKKTTTPLPEKPKTEDPSVPAPLPVATRSTSQQSFDQKIENFTTMVLLLKGVSSYTPNEPELNIAGLEVLLDKLTDLNNKATNDDATRKTARTDRNVVLYAPETGIYDTVKKSKAYVLGIFGRGSEQHKDSVAYKFTKTAR